MRRADKEITDRHEIDEIVRGCRVCHLGLADAEGPYVVPISFGYDGTAVYLHTANRGRKIDIFTDDPRVCVQFERNVELVTHETDACRWTTRFESVIGFGTITELTNDAEKVHGLNHIMRHYSGRDWSYDSPHFAATRVWRIDLDTLTGKRSDGGG